MLEEHTKMNVLTPPTIQNRYEGQLEEHTKMNVLTPTKHGKKQSRWLEGEGTANRGVLLKSSLKILRILTL